MMKLQSSVDGAVVSAERELIQIFKELTRKQVCNKLQGAPPRQ